MAGMILKRRSRHEIEQANQELLDLNRAYMQRWVDSRLQSSSPAEAEVSDDRNQTESNCGTVDFR
jgi:hypothetical protein